MSDQQPAPTRLDPAPTRLDIDAGAPAVREPGHLINLPKVLAAHWSIDRVLPAAGAEAELIVLRNTGGASRAMLKLYRAGLRPRTSVIERLSGAATRHVVRVYARGEDRGQAWELMEFVERGSLRNLLGGLPADRAMLRNVLAELTAALQELHAAGLIHRDLKPENVLVRALDPLDLVLTDFGIASALEATHHFTTTSRTVRYGAPEAMTGVLTVKADWWSLGIIVLEALLGRHPFDGLSEAVVNHQLATRSVDLSAVTDLTWRALLAGLLRRDPDKRWSGTEVGDWLDGRTSIAAALTSGDDLPATATRPYRIAGETFDTAPSLGAALLRYWDIGTRDVGRGMVTTWLRDELHDQELTRAALDLAERTKLSAEGRLVRTALLLAPDLPAVWRDTALTEAGLRGRIAAALDGQPKAQDWIASLFHADGLMAWAEVRAHADADRLSRLSACWRSMHDRYRTRLADLAAAEHGERKKLRDPNTPPDMDELMYGAPPPVIVEDSSEALALLLAPALLPEAVLAAHAKAVAGQIELTACQAWLGGELAEDDAPAIAALLSALPRARDIDQELKKRRVQREEQLRDLLAQQTQALNLLLGELRSLGEAGVFSLERLPQQLQALRRRCEDQHTVAHAQHGESPDFARLSQTLSRMAASMDGLQQRADRIDTAVQRRRIIFTRGYALWAGGFVLWLLFSRQPLWLALLIGAAGMIAILPWWATVRLRAAIRRVGWQLPRRIRMPEATEGGGGSGLASPAAR